MTTVPEAVGPIPDKRYPCLRAQARTEQNKAGAHLAEAARTLEAEAEEARKAVAAVLALDRAEVYSSIQAWVLDKIGIGPSDENSTPSGRDHRHGGAEFANAGGLREKEVPGHVGVVQEAVMLAEVSHRREHLVFAGGAHSLFRRTLTVFWTPYLKMMYNNFVQSCIRVTAKRRLNQLARFSPGTVWHLFWVPGLDPEPV